MINLPGAPALSRLGSGVGLSWFACLLCSAIALVWFVVAWVMVDGAPALSPVTYALSGGLGLTGCLLVMLVLRRRCRQAEQAERHALDMYGLVSQALNAVSADVQIKDADRRYVWVGTGHGHRTGCNAAEMLGKTVEEIGIDPASAAAVTAHDRRVLASAEAGEPQEQVIQGSDGRLKYISLVTKVPLLRDGKVSHIVTLTADLRHWQEKQRSAEEVRRLLETVLDATPVTVHVTDRDLRLRWVNRAFCDHIGWKTGSPVGKTLLEALPPDSLMPEAVATHRALLEGQQRMMHLKQRHPATDYRPERHLLVTKVAIHDAAGAVVQVLTMGTDMTALMQAEAAAETANRLVERLLQHVPLDIHVKDADLRYRWVNNAFARSIGQDAAAVLGRTVDDLAIPAHARLLTNRMDRQVLSTGKTIQFDERWILNDAARHMTVIKTPMLDAAGHATHVITIGANLAELDRLRAEVDESRRQLQVVLDTAPLAISLKDTNRRYLWVNRCFEQAFGHSAGSVIGRRAEDFIADESLTAKVAKRDEAVLAGELEAHPMTQHHLLPDGRVMDLSVRRHVVRGADGKINGILVIGMEVTELLRTTAELQRLNEELEQRVAERAGELAKVNAFVATMIDRAPVPIVAVDLDGRIRSWNPAATRATGYSEAEALNKSALALFPDDHAQIAEQLQFMRHGIFGSNIETRHRRRDGVTSEFLVSSAPMMQDDGTVSGAITTWLDVTRQRAAERQLRQAQKMEAIGQLTGNVAHDFNNLLTVVIGNLDLVLEAMPAEARTRELVNDAINAAERGVSLTGHLLAFARQQTLRPVTVNLISLIDGMRPLLRRAVGEVISVRYVSDANPWPTRVDPSQLESAILNLAVNARDAMPKGGVLTIDIRNATPNEVRALLQGDADAADHVCVSVSDTGNGIEPKILAHVFEPFFTTKKTGKGTGLGLSIVYGFVKQSGGHVHVSSEVGHGTCISLYLPRVAEGTEEAAADKLMTNTMFDGAKYLSLETFRKTGQGVCTPVWFADGPDALYVYTTAASGKVKRVRRDGRVRIAPCDARGKVTGDWRNARAVIVGPDEFALGMRLLNRKYRPWKQILDLSVLLLPHHERIVLAIRLT